jgi:hypothetical protein
MAAETLGEAWSLGWNIHIRCLYDGREGMKLKRSCGFKQELDLMTLFCTRGRDFPVARIADRLRCPRCGCREVSVMFTTPANRQVNAAAARLPRDHLYED